MKFYSKVASYRRVPDAIRQFGGSDDSRLKGIRMPRMKIVLENGVEFVLEEQGHSPEWSFTTKTRAKVDTPVPSCLGASYRVNDKFVLRENGRIIYDVTEESLEFVELSGSQEDRLAFEWAMGESVENAV